MKTTLILSTLLGTLANFVCFSQSLDRLSFKLEKEDLASTQDSLMFEGERDGFGDLSWEDGTFRGEREDVDFLQVDISNQKLKNLPREFKNNQWISRLDASNNDISKLGRRFSKLRADSIILSGNKIEGLRNQWFRPMFPLFFSVSYLDISDNQLESIPSVSLQRMKYLDLGYNKIKVVSLSNACPMMEELHLSNNELSKFYFKTSKYNSFKVLTLSDNLLKQCPKSIYRLKNLEEIDLSNNQIEKISTRICRLSKLKKLDLSGNKIPRVILEKIANQLPEGCEFVY